MDTGIDERSIVREQLSAQLFLEFDLGAKFFGHAAWHNQVAKADSRAASRSACNLGKQPSGFVRAHQLADIGKTEGVN
jgi:hypothetical protein